MPDHIIYGYKATSFSISPLFSGSDVYLTLDPDFDASTDIYQWRIDDADTVVDGDTYNDDIGDDTTQYAQKYDSDNTFLIQGQVYAEVFYALEDGMGNTVTLYTIESAGQISGFWADAPVQPGVDYRIASYGEVTDTNAPAYDDIVTPVFDPADANTVEGGAWNDSLSGGALDDTINGFSGNDRIEGGDGADSILGGAGDDTLAGGADDDVITGGTGNDQMSGGLGNDTFVAGLGNDTISDFNFGNSGTLDDENSANNDFVDLSAYYDHISELYADLDDDGILNHSNTTDMSGNAVDYTNNTAFGVNSLEFTATEGNANHFTVENTGVVCFTTGTAIRTPRGDVLIDDLRIGDLVSTLDNGPQPIRWIGARHLDSARLAACPALRPVRISRGVFGATRDLLVSPQHAMLIGPKGTELARATHLVQTVNGIRVAQGKRQVTYVHLMFDAHQIIFAENAPSESFFPGPMALNMVTPAQNTEILALFPDLRQMDTPRFGPPVRPFSSKRALLALCA